VTVRSGEAAWPATGPGAEEAELALRGALTGTAGPSPLRAVAEQTAAVLSPLERLVFTGGASPVDSEVIRRAAVLRLRAAATMAIRPPPGSPVDGAAVAGLLSEIDVLLGAVKDLLDQAPLEAQVSLETIRNALVKEAVDFSEASHEIGAGDASLPPPRRITGRGAAVRVLSVNAGVLAEDRPEERRRGWLIWVMLALAALGAGAFHGFSWWQKEQASAELKTLPGQPDGMMLVPGPPGSVRTLIPLQGPIDRSQLERFKTQQQLLGNVVTELPGGGLSVSREPPPPRGADQRAP